MAARPWEYADQARAALRVIVADPRLGLKALSDESQAASVLEDLLPEAPRERAILVMAAKAGLAQALHDYAAQGIGASTAINLTTSSFAETSPLDSQACHWVVTELAIALGITTPERQDAEDRPVADLPVADLPPAHPPTVVAEIPARSPDVRWPAASPALPQADQRHGRRSRDNLVNDVAFSPDGQMLGTAGYDGTARLWSVGTRALMSRLDGHSGPVRSIAFSPDGRMIATAGADCTRLWTPSLVLAITPGPARDAVFSPDGRLLATAGGGKISQPGGAAGQPIDNAAWLWDVATGQSVTSLAGQGGYVSAVAFSPDGRLLATAATGDVVRLWDVSGGQQVLSLSRRSKQARDLAFSPDGSLLATGGGRDPTRLWEVSSGTEVRSVTQEPAWSMAFSPDGRVLATGGGGNRPAAGGAAAAMADKAAWLWDVATGKLVDCLTGHDGEVHAIAFSPAGDFLATSSPDRTVRLWHLGSRTSTPLDISAR